jgi:ribose/xylose/arabinose/galactoside ABC-type transport system permease subunit
VQAVDEGCQRPTQQSHRLRSSSRDRWIVAEPPSLRKRHTFGLISWRVIMAAIVRAISHTWSETKAEIDILKAVAMFCAAGLLVSILFATYGLDLSAGFF